LQGPQHIKHVSFLLRVHTILQPHHHKVLTNFPENPVPRARPSVY
jgi:hypothetical protein